jgi:hypothetical protein
LKAKERLKQNKIMKTSRNILAIGTLLVAGGITTAVTSFDPSRILQYLFIGLSVTISALGFRVWQQSKSRYPKSSYYMMLGFIVLALAISVSIWATAFTGFINVLGFFLILLGIIEFVFARQILVYQTPTPWGLVGLKLVISTITATGATWILTMAGLSENMALLFMGVLFTIVGLAFMKVSQMATDSKGVWHSE